MKLLKVLVVGCGKRGQAIAKQMNEKEDCKVVKVIDSRKESAEALAKEIADCEWGTDYEKAIAETDASILVVATPPFLHVPIALLGVERGMHILCEKPLGLNLSECDTLIERAKAKNLKIGVYHQLRLLPAYRQAIELVREGALGHPLMVRRHSANNVRPNIMMHDRHTNGGVVLDVACHTFDIVRYLFASEATKVSAVGALFAFDTPSLRQIDILAVDTASMNVEYASGSILSMSMSWGLPPGVGADGLFDVIGPKGLLKIDTKKLELIREGGKEEVFEDFDDALDLNEDFLQAIRDNRDPIVSGEDGRESLRVALAALQSIETGSPVAVSPLISVRN